MGELTEVMSDIKREKANLKKQLMTLYRLFHKTELATASKRERILGEEVETAKERLRVLTDRKNVIAAAGHGAFCPCCGLELPMGYLDELEEDFKATSELVSKLESRLNKIATMREQNVDKAITDKIGVCQRNLERLDALEREAKMIGIV